MKRLLFRVLLACAVLAFILPLGLRAQDTSRAERDAERAAERAQRAADRAAERAQRIEDRINRRIDRSFDDHDGAHILIGRSYELPEGSIAPERVVVIGGNATINGRAEDDVVVVGGTLRLGPKAVVLGDVSAVGGELDRDPGAQVSGDVNVAHVRFPDVSGWVFGVPDNWSRWWWTGAAAAFTIGRIVLILFLSVVMLAIAPRWIDAIASRLIAAPGVSTLLGFAGEMLFAPAMIALAVALIITIVGIPLLAALPLIAAGFGLMWIGGYAAVTGVIGARLRGVDWRYRGLGPTDVLVGTIAVSGVTLIGQFLMMASGWLVPVAMAVRGTGWLIEYMAWTVALGAALGAWRGGTDDRRGVVPPVPPLPTPAPSSM